MSEKLQCKTNLGEEYTAFSYALLEIHELILNEKKPTLNYAKTSS